MLMRHKLKFAPEGDNGSNSGGAGGANNGAGGSGAGAANSGTGGGSNLLTGEQSGGSGNAADKGGQAAGNNGGTNTTDIKFPDNWKSALPKELQDSAALQLIADIPALAKSYVNAQKLVGADKIPMPSKHATAEEWREVYHKLGLPKEAKDYKIDHAKDGGLNEAFIPKLAAKAHEIGIMPAQAKALADWMGSANKEALAEIDKSKGLKFQEDITGLKTEWGAAFQQNLAEAQAAVKHFATKEEVAYLEKSGLTNDINLVKIFAKVAGVLKEDGIITTAGTDPNLLSPAAAQEAANLILRDSSHPYYQKDHPGHKPAVAEVTRLFAMAASKKK